MKNKILIVLLILISLIAAGLGFQVYRSSGSSEQAQTELKELLEQRTREVGRLNQEVETLKSERSRLQRQQEELHRLRAEVTALNEQIAEESNRVQQAEAQRQKMEQRLQAMQDQAEIQTAQPAAAASDGRQRMAFHEMPAGVQATLRSQYNGVRFEELSSFDKEGQLAYLMTGKHADGRDVKAILDPQGNVQEQYLDVMAEELPANVLQTIRTSVDANGDFNFSQAWIEGNTTYTGTIQQRSPQGTRELKVTVTEDGQIIQSNDVGPVQ